MNRKVSETMRCTTYQSQAPRDLAYLAGAGAACALSTLAPAPLKLALRAASAITAGLSLCWAR